MDDRDDGNALAFLFSDHSTTIARLAASSDAVGSSSSRIGRLGDEAAGDVDALLLAARESQRRHRPQPLGNVKPPQQLP